MSLQAGMAATSFPRSWLRSCEMRGWRERGEFNVDARSHPDFRPIGAPLRLGFTIYRNAFYHTSDGQGLTARPASTTSAWQWSDAPGMCRRSR